jgi:hypothetical protein
MHICLRQPAQPERNPTFSLEIKHSRLPSLLVDDGYRECLPHLLNKKYAAIGACKNETANNPEKRLMMQKTVAECLFIMAFIGKTYMVRYVLLLFALLEVT